MAGKTALIIVDIQNDFCEGGSLAVPNANEVIEGINRIKEERKSEFDYCIFTKDWHPQDHTSFAVNHDQSPFSTKIINNILHTLWPVHCVANTEGAALHKNLILSENDIIFEKGKNKDAECYSGFVDIYGNETGLTALLREKGVCKLYVCGLALDYCVKSTCLDAVKEGFKTICLFDLTKGIAKDTSYDSMDQMLTSGVTVTHSQFAFN